MKQVHSQAAQDPETLRISLDTKAKVKIGAFSRGGEARGQEAVAAADHDMHPDAVLVPAGILEVERGQLNVVFGTSRDTSERLVSSRRDRIRAKNARRAAPQYLGLRDELQLRFNSTTPAL
ncbi:MAG: hypothetical protein K2R98_00430 [Gemmataceae bacterium]|nr:hypothetical protein [Gemmataceae bacterium]